MIRCNYKLSGEEMTHREKQRLARKKRMRTEGKVSIWDTFFWQKRKRIIAEKVAERIKKIKAAKSKIE